MLRDIARLRRMNRARPSPVWMRSLPVCAGRDESRDESSWRERRCDRVRHAV